MKRIVNLAVLLAVLVCGFLCPSLARSQPSRDQCVILVSVDGLADFYLDDPRADMPTIRRLAREGARARGMVTSFPSVTWAAHTTLATGAWPAKHGVLANSYLDRATGEKVTLLCDPVFDQHELVKTPTIYDVAHAAGLRTAGVLWPASRNSRTLNWSVPDMPGDAWERFGTPSWLAELRLAGLPIEQHGPWCAAAGGGVQRDWLYVRLARHVLREHAPNLLLIHLVEPDHVQHAHGPRSPEAYWCASYADDRIRDLVEAVEDSPLAGKTSLFVCSDHGFFPIRRTICPNVLLGELGLAGPAGGGEGRPAALAHSQGGAAGVYIFDSSRRASILQQLVPALAGLEGVAAVIRPEEFAGVGQARPEHDPRCPDLWLTAESGYSFADTLSGAPVTDRQTVGGTHGYLPDQPDMLAACVAWGPAIQRGAELPKIEAIDIAPTIARLLGLEMPTADGKPLQAMLR